MLLSSTFGTEAEIMANTEMACPAIMPSPDLIYLVCMDTETFYHTIADFQKKIRV